MSYFGGFQHTRKMTKKNRKKESSKQSLQTVHCFLSWLRTLHPPRFFFLTFLRKDLLSLLNKDALLLDASLLTCELTQVVQLRATYLTVLVNLDRVNVW